jgi:hypothetical protein
MPLCPQAQLMQDATSAYADSEAGESEYWGGNIAVGEKIFHDLQMLQQHCRGCPACTDVDGIVNADFSSPLQKSWAWVKSLF